MLNILQSIEAVSIPIKLQLYGMNVKASLSTYGVLTGMALPCILFPSAITNSVSTMLLPTVAEIQAMDERSQLSSLIRKVFFPASLLAAYAVQSSYFSDSGSANFFSTVRQPEILLSHWHGCVLFYTRTIRCSAF